MHGRVMLLVCVINLVSLNTFAILLLNLANVFSDTGFNSSLNRTTIHYCDIALSVTRVVGGQYSSPIRVYFRTVIALGKVTQYHLLRDKTPFQYLHANVKQVHTGPFGPFKSVNIFIYNKQQHTVSEKRLCTQRFNQKGAQFSQNPFQSYET